MMSRRRMGFELSYKFGFGLVDVASNQKTPFSFVTMVKLREYVKPRAILQPSVKRSNG